MKLLLKRHIASGDSANNFPAPDQVAVGELVINSVTGKLYTKLEDGSVVEFISQRICFQPVPGIVLYYNGSIVNNNIINNYCALGGLISAEVNGLLLLNNYTFELLELTNNTQSPNDITIHTESYSEYSITENNKTISLKKAIVPIELKLTNGDGKVSIFKFSVKSNNNVSLKETIITVKCVDTPE